MNTVLSTLLSGKFFTCGLFRSILLAGLVISPLTAPTATYISSWNLTSLTISGVSFTNTLPPKW